MHGHGKEALKHFEQVCEEGYSQMISLLCLLSACSHAVLMDKEGMCCCVSMTTVYMISAKLEHHTCMVDLLGPKP
jgi:hypothetical protein